MGQQSFIPGGMVATFSQGVALGRRRATSGRRRRKKKTASPKRRRKSASGRRSGGRKPRPGTKAWMAYIRGKRKKR